MTKLVESNRPLNETMQRAALVNWQNLAVEAQFRPVLLAEMCGLSLRTVQRHFKKRYGVTLGDWIRSYRLQLAYDRLRSGDPIKCVALDLGYKQLSHFSRDFKKLYGCAPKFLNEAKPQSGPRQEPLPL
jgi:AraC-like DNA-binding protein